MPSYAQIFVTLEILDLSPVYGFWIELKRGDANLIRIHKLTNLGAKTTKTETRSMRNL